MTEHGYTVAGFLPAEIPGSGVADKELHIDKVSFKCALVVSDLVPLEKFLPDTNMTSARKERNKILERPISFLLKPLRLAAEHGFELSVRSGET